MFLSRLESIKPTPHFEAFGGNSGMGYNFKRNNNQQQEKKSDELIIIDYLKLNKKIQIKKEELNELENERVELSNKIMNNPTLKKMFEELIAENSCEKVKK